jgi:hypothetical protein
MVSSSSQLLFPFFPLQGKHWDRDENDTGVSVAMATNRVLKVPKRHVLKSNNLEISKSLNSSNHQE